MRTGVTLSLAVAAWACLGQAALGACALPGPKLSRLEVENLVDEPKRLLTRHPNGGPALVFEVQAFAIAGQDTLAAVLKAVRGASFDQRQAVGLGLKRATSFCLGRDPAIAKRIDEGVRKLGDRDVSLAYHVASDPKPLPVTSPADRERAAAGALSPSGVVRPGLSPPDPAAARNPAFRIGTPSRPLDGTDLNLPDPGRISDPSVIR